jgi:hypothetical protein
LRWYDMFSPDVLESYFNNRFSILLFSIDIIVSLLFLWRFGGLFKTVVMAVLLSTGTRSFCLLYLYIVDSGNLRHAVGSRFVAWSNT